MDLLVFDSIYFFSAQSITSTNAAQSANATPITTSYHLDRYQKYQMQIMTDKKRMDVTII